MIRFVADPAASRSESDGEETRAGIAQMAERQPSKLRVAGSNPVSRSIDMVGPNKPAPDARVAQW